MDLAEAKKTIQQVIASGPFDKEWTSLKAYKVPEWYQNAKFGIFIHWGVYSVPAFGNEWYPRNMYLQDSDVFRHHVETYGPQSRFGYKDFIPLFTAEKFDPDHWAGLFRKAGAQFVVPVAEHHDGFPMYDCTFTEWNAAKMGPKRDIIGELAEAVRKQWLVFGLSSHRAEHWWFFNEGTKFDSDVQDPRFASLYGPARPKTLPPNDIQKFAAYYYNRGAQWERGVAINYKHQAFAEETAVFDIERGQTTDILPYFWQNDTSISKNSWGYVQSQDYKSAEALIGDLVDIVSKNGALLLNIGPRPDGTIPEPEEKILLDMGRWLSINGEAIYGTRPWKLFGEGPTQVVGGSFNDTKHNTFTSQDIRFTTQGDILYAIVLARPENGSVTIKTLAENSALYQRPIGKVELLSTGKSLKWVRNYDGLTIDIPGQMPSNDAFVLRISQEHS